jgi:hypothetical protein
MHPLNRVLHPLALALARLATRVFHVTNRGLFCLFPNPKNVYFSGLFVGGGWWWGRTHYLLSGKRGLMGVAFVSAQ